MEVLSTALSEGANSIFEPGVKFVIDESLYEFLGKSPAKRYIPRKPHPNGLLCYALCGEIMVDTFRLPLVLDSEAYTVENNVGPHKAMMRLLSRFKERHVTVKPHLFVDSAFGSFDRLNEIVKQGTIGYL